MAVRWEDGTQSDLKANELRGGPGSQYQILGSDVLPSGKHIESYWKWQFLVYLPTKNGDFP